MRRIREIESGFGRALSYIGAFLLISLFVFIPLVFLNSNLVWGEANQYGRVPIPGHKVIHLPAGDVQVNVAAALPGRGNETPELLLPTLTLTMKAKGGQEAPLVSEDIGSSTNANDNYVDTQRRVWKLEVPEEGNYLAILKGDFTGYGVNAQAWFGREPSPLHGWTVVLVAMLITAVGIPIYLGGRALLRRRRGPTRVELDTDADVYRRQAEQEEVEENLKRNREGAL
ncbi:MAG TPA: hypothetical protein VMH33_08975 [Solirubrobacterales bacterium]|nr:hypothetical protein [Solirubrobacterales bacterium]